MTSIQFFPNLLNRLEKNLNRRYREKQLKGAFVRAAWDGKRLGPIKINIENELKAHLVKRRPMMNP
jgi:hypothetical protein